MRARIAMVVVTLVVASPAAVDAGAEGRVVVEVHGLRSVRGQVRAGLFEHTGTWLREGHERARCRVDVTARIARCSFGTLPPGRYALSLMHDEDGDGELDRDFFGVPTEGFAFSNDAPVGLGGPPSFERACFAHREEDEIVRVAARYGL
ncbi:DUF2141 domain-containing protein [Sandaracinus amylolyticus]|nr:DUF2141 domain-containing protein [Sandaracinus amylolyticus]